MLRLSRRGLLLTFALSIALFSLILLWDAPLSLVHWRISLIFCLPALPVFCAQALLCGLTRFRWLRWLPLALLFALAALGTGILLLGSGWASIGGGLLLCLCIAPAAGCALGWMTVPALRPRVLGAIGTGLMLAVYLGLKVLGGVPVWHLEPLDLAALTILGAGLVLLWRGRASGT